MTIKIYKPSKTAMQSGHGKTKQWLAEYVSDVSTTKDILMGWTSSSDTKSQIKLFFETKDISHNSSLLISNLQDLQNLLIPRINQYVFAQF